MKVYQRILAAAVIASIAACGGGGSSSTTTSTNSSTGTVTGFDNKEFQGSWARIQVACLAYGNSTEFYIKYDKPYTISENKEEFKSTIFSDSNCITKVGMISAEYETSWSAGPTIINRTNVARVTSTLIAFTKSIDTDGQGTNNFANFPNPTIGRRNKTLFDVNSGFLYFGDYESTLDSEGFPTKLYETANYKK